MNYLIKNKYILLIASYFLLSFEKFLFHKNLIAIFTILYFQHLIFLNNSILSLLSLNFLQNFCVFK